MTRDLETPALARILEAGPGDFVGRDAGDKEEFCGVARTAVAGLWNATLGLAVDPKTRKRHGLEKIFVEGFDAEQIWCQLDQQTPKLLKSIDKQLERIEEAGNAARLEDEDGGSESESGESGGEPASSDDSQFDEFLTHELAEEAAKSDSTLDDSGSYSSDVSDDEGDGEDPDVASESNSSEDEDEEEEGDLLPTEDQFFRLGQMEDFVQQAEELYEREQMSEDNDDDDEESDEEGEVGTDDSEDERVRGLMYGDYFAKRAGGRRKSVRFAEDVGEEEEEEQEDFATVGGVADPAAGVGPQEEDSGEGEKKSRQEVRAERMERRIKRLEDANMAEAHWSMRGEVKASQRPENSLLEVDLDFQHSSEPPIEPTQEIADELEDIIKTRIVEGRFDDVIPAVLPDASAEARTLEGEELDDKKATRGLAEVYESEFMQARGLSDVEDKQRRKQEACWTLYRSIAARLDALSHFQFTPKPQAESVGDPNAAPSAPAVAMEEVGLEALSTAGTLAPGEVKARSKGLEKAEGELETKERKSRRRANKKRGRKEAKGKAEEAAPRRKVGRKDGESPAPTGGERIRYAKSGDVFKLLQEREEAAAARGGSGGKPADPERDAGRRGAGYKL